ncbi:UvrD-helicase domain-containing protein [Nocardia xishanensis]|uniref:UvrD-helicase domain-containing protein n=1 Tax=Nocardia xishanensis TaxID=238964 RepID=UPI0034137C39
MFALVFADEVPSESELRSVRRHAEETFANLYSGRSQYIPHMIQVVVVSSADTPVSGDGRFRVATAQTLRSIMLGNDAALNSNSARHLVKTVAARLSGYELITTDEAPIAETVEAEGLFTDVEVREHERDRMLGRPFAEWMTFLDPEQLSLVNRKFNGPARFSGPAGTGKTVVALHRMARFAKHNSGRLLFTSFVKTLPTYHRSGFERIAPHVGDRAEFTNLHAWAVRFLREREAMPQLNTEVCDNAYSHTWLKARDHLTDIKGTGVEYWKDELERVIKGRGITSLKEYQGIQRTGRNRVILTDSRREIVWKAIYEPYQAILEQHRVCDLNDVVSAAVAELRRRPLEEPYGLVVVDEVQDFTLLELQLVHQIAGGRDDSQLLLVGDGQQQVYPGGWTLSDAGIPIVGRGAVLRVNYRNRVAVHDYAKSVDATNVVDDLDGGPGFVLRDTEVVLPGGRADGYTGRRSDVETRLIEAVKNAAATITDIAVLTNTKSEAARLADRLTKAGVPTLPLTRYDGTQPGAVKTGTVHRAKGMDFAAVFHITTRSGARVAELTGAERDRAELAARQTMVALTRARDYIWVGVVDNQVRPF